MLTGGSLTINDIYGNTLGLKTNQIKKIQRIYRRRIFPQEILTSELAHYLASLAWDIKRQLGVLINRQGIVEYVIAGDAKSILIPDLSGFRSGTGRLKGLRCIHTHLREEPLSQDDCNDLALLRLDLMAALKLSPTGVPDFIQFAHLLPDNPQGKIWQTIGPVSFGALNFKFLDFIEALENEFARRQGMKEVSGFRDLAGLVRVTTGPKILAEDSLIELKELAKSCGIKVLDSIIQQRDQIDPKFVVGKNRLSDLVIRCLQLGVNMLIFDHNLTPAQVRSITDFTELKIIDRTQLILDIFAQRATSREGKIQVEMAQLKYLLPRLITKNTAMSRLTGGIGGRGPGETKLEINRRRAKERMNHLKKDLELIGRRRKLRRSKREKRGIPTISLIGYTNAGKSTMLNALSDSDAASRDQPFTTLDPTSRKIRLPGSREVIITDTVGFIRDLPPDLINAFSATLDELKEADLLLHVIDMSDPNFRNQISAVENILADLQLTGIPLIRVLNKEDKVDHKLINNFCRTYQAISISAKVKRNLLKLTERIECRFIDFDAERKS